MLCAVQQAGHRDHPTPNVLVPQPDDLGFGVALGSAGEEDGVPRGDICVLGLGRDPGSFCTNKEMENFLVLSRQGSKDPSDTPYVMSKSQVFKLYAATDFPTKWQTVSSMGDHVTGQSPHSVLYSETWGGLTLRCLRHAPRKDLSGVRSCQGSETPVQTAYSMSNGFQ